MTKSCSADNDMHGRDATNFKKGEPLTSISFKKISRSDVLFNSKKKHFLLKYKL